MRKPEPCVARVGARAPRAAHGRSTSTPCAPPPPTAHSGTCASRRCPSRQTPGPTSRPRWRARLAATCCRSRCATSPTDRIVGSTRYHDIVPAVERLEIGYTWYAASRQRSFVNTECKLLLMEHAFETLGAQLVGWRTDNFNFASQRAIERLGARRDGVLRHHALRRDGTVRDTVMYSLAAGEWPEVKAQLRWQLERPR